MQVKLLNWSYRGIRGVNNLDISVEQRSNSPWPISLIMMPNGTGKTTTITLLRAIFHGEAANWTETQVREFKPATGDVEQGEFKATLNVNGSIYVVFLELEYARGKVVYKTTRVGDEGGNDYGHKLPPLIKYIFTEKFVERFIFDGELAKQILRSDSKEAERAIRYLYSLNFLDGMQEQIKKIVDKAQQLAEKTSAKTDQGLARLRNERDRVERIFDVLVARKNVLEKDLETKRSKYSQVKKKIADHIKADENLRKNAEEVENQQKSIHFDISSLVQNVLIDLKNPYMLSEPIANRLNGLASKMQQLKLPKTMSKQFFEELAYQPTCICGRSIGQKESQTILKNATKYLAEDQIGVINAIKSAVRGKSYDDSLKFEIGELNKKIVERDLINKRWHQLQAKRKESGDLELETIEQEEKELDNEIPKIEKEFRDLTTRDKRAQVSLTYTKNIPLCEEELSLANERLAEATNTLILTKKAEVLKNYLQLIELEALKRLEEKIMQESNKKIAQMLKNEPIQIEGIDGHLVLRNKTGASEGQTLAIAYSYLGSIFECSSYKLPFIIDSPAGKLDLDVRRDVSVILPELFDQLIIFITSGERKAFCDYFFKLDNVQYLTVPKLINPINSHSIEGIDAFRYFQEEEEETV